MDYVVGSIAALLTGNVTPNRPKPLRNARTPMKNQPSPNVTPKSEFVEDRSIFLSPTMQKKKAMAKKSPKRIFQSSDLDVTNGEDNDASLISPKADKVKKHLKNDLETDSLASTTLLSPKSPKNSETSPKKGNKKRLSDNIIVTDENTPKKKKRVSEIGNDDSIIQNEKEDILNAKNNTENTPKKTVKRRKSVMEINNDSSLENNISESSLENNTSKKKNKKPINEFTVEEWNISTEVTEGSNTNTSVIENPKKGKKKKKNKTKQNGNVEIESKDTNEAEKESENKEVDTNAGATETQGVLLKKKKNKRRKKSKQTELTNSANSSTATNIEGDSNKEMKSQNTSTIAQDPIKKKKNQRKKKSKQTKEQIESSNNSNTNMKVDSTNNASESTSKDNPKKKKKKSKLVKNNDQAESGATEPVKVNPNAVTNQDTDSEHDSDDEIDSENEEDNKKVLDTGPAVDSSDEEAPEEKSINKEGKQKIDQLIAEDELKRTLFVGNVPFSAKTKKEMKKIFNKYGKIETVRIRTVPVKDARDTPKLAIIKKELHPDRTTVHVYIRFSTALAVQEALVENNTVLNGCHLRVQPSESSGVPHDPKCSIFVGNVPFTLEDEALRGKFEKCGEIESVRIVRDRATCIGKGMGFVNFKSKDSVELALAMTEEDLTIKNRILRVKRCTAPTEKQLQRREHNNQGMKSTGKKFGGGTQNDSGKKRNFRRQEQGNEAGSFGGSKFGGRQNNFGKKENFRRQDRGNEAGSFNRGKFGDRQNDFGKKDNFRRQDQGNAAGSFNRGKFGDRQNDFGKRENFRRQDQGNKVGNFSRGKFDGQDADKNSGAYRRVMNKRKNEDGAEGPPNKRQNVDQPPREKKERKEFVGMTAEKKKKNKFDKGLKKKKVLSEILTK